MMILFQRTCTECGDCTELMVKDGNCYIPLLSGDYYHDKIDKKIEGYLKALNDFNIKYELSKKDFICDYCICGDCGKTFDKCQCEIDND